MSQSYAPRPPASVPTGRAIVDIRNLSKTYVLGDTPVHALDGVDLAFQPGEFVAVTGTSGSGKSTLLNVLGCLDQPTGGQYLLNGRDISGLDDDELSMVRCHQIGFIFQSYLLISSYTVLENIEVPLYYSGRLTRPNRERCRELAHRVGLGDRLGHRPNELSGGQQQRVAIARSLVNEPDIMLADEPTGNLDSTTTEEIMALLAEVNASGKTIIMVTHEDEIAARAKRNIVMRDGKVLSDISRTI